MADPVVNHVLIPFEWKINTGYPQGIKIYLQSAQQIDKEYYKLDISVSNTKDIIDHFISISNKYDWGCLELMIDNGAGANNIFWQVEKIQIADIHLQ